MNWSTDDRQYMGLALQLAKKGQYTARPNPMVGCVIVNEGKVVGQGWHQKSGLAHAEINALKQAGENARNATCYVTLEPCSHVGKTGSCAEALVKAGVTRVIVAMTDPNPLVQGRGFAILNRAGLNEAGIETHRGLLESQAKELNKGFISKFEKQRPWVSLKLAMSLDGRTALDDGSSKWITGKAARFDVQQLRARQDAIITGIGTVLADDPSLNIRGDDNENSHQQQWFSKLENFEQPIRILLDRNSQAEVNSKFFSPDSFFNDRLVENNGHGVNKTKQNVWWVVGDPSIKKESVAENIKLLGEDSLESLLKKCTQADMNNVLIEAGHRLAGKFIQRNLVDEIIVYMAPKLMGNDALGLFDLSVSKMSDCYPLDLQSVRQFGDDIRLIYRPKSIDS